VDAVTGVGAGAAEVDADDPNSPSMSSTAERGAGAAEEVEGGAAVLGVLDPKISARRS